jgi:hypothetical protein
MPKLNLPPLFKGKTGCLLKIILSFLGLCVFSAFVLFLIENSPQYTDLKISPPDYYLGGYAGDWKNITYSTRPDIQTKDFVLRKETTVSYDEAHDIVNWQSILNYFDKKMDQAGWVRTPQYIPCDLYMPEVKFLPQGDNGYVYYVRKEDEKLGNYDANGFVCLAVWEDLKTEKTFYIVFITVNPTFFSSLLRTLMSI